jgi:hypothetical protein
MYNKGVDVSGESCYSMPVAIISCTFATNKRKEVMSMGNLDKPLFVLVAIWLWGLAIGPMIVWLETTLLDWLRSLDLSRSKDKELLDLKKRQKEAEQYRRFWD